MSDRVHCTSCGWDLSQHGDPSKLQICPECGEPVELYWEPKRATQLGHSSAPPAPESPPISNPAPEAMMVEAPTPPLPGQNPFTAPEAWNDAGAAAFLSTGSQESSSAVETNPGLPPAPPRRAQPQAPPSPPRPREAVAPANPGADALYFQAPAEGSAPAASAPLQVQPSGVILDLGDPHAAFRKRSPKNLILGLGAVALLAAAFYFFPGSDETPETSASSSEGAKAVIGRSNSPEIILEPDKDFSASADDSAKPPPTSSGSPAPSAADSAGFANKFKSSAQ